MPESQLPKSDPQAAVTLPLVPPEKYPPVGFPLLFVEFVSTIFLGSGIVKFYLTRINNPVVVDPAAGPSEQVPILPICQVAMPLDAFVNTVVFFDNYLENLIATGVVTREFVETMRTSLTNESSPNAK